ncbi:HlyU family transcriptional regulator [Vibrio nigripulchritudo]|uniref:HlyU family transcriptional regulator n=1 Tax=Vibrio nigripulchritudo TaxID=28173 RepID=UPI002491059B|nr:HlyU family transcriptional regulator [Vibrio nigripulchritudo]BDU40132.1 transcriptional activator HlyU [Vibrio nigripulchritudo]BDU45866.1 transcriptional activator HlyU [Vibrio nigripulchritudo]
MGLFSRLFGGSKEQVVQEAEPVEYKGYLIYQEPKAEGGQYRIAGRIIKEFESGEVKSHTFIRSDVLASEQDANEFMLKKAQMFIDQMGDSIFN